MVDFLYDKLKYSLAYSVTQVKHRFTIYYTYLKVRTPGASLTVKKRNRGGLPSTSSYLFHDRESSQFTSLNFVGEAMTGSSKLIFPCCSTGLLVYP